MWIKHKILLFPTQNGSITKEEGKFYVGGSNIYNKSFSSQPHTYYVLSWDSVKDEDFEKHYIFHVDAAGDEHIIKPNTWRPNPRFCSKIVASSDFDLKLPLLNYSFIHQWFENQDNFIELESNGADADRINARFIPNPKKQRILREDDTIYADVDYIEHFELRLKIIKGEITEPLYYYNEHGGKDIIDEFGNSTHQPFLVVNNLLKEILKAQMEKRK